jgi:hypothetical protein
VDTLTYTATLHGESVALRRVPILSLADVVWQEFADNIAQERHLIAYPIQVLSRRWEQGYAAIAIKDDEIIGYSSVVLNFSEAIGIRLSQEVGVEHTRMPQGNIYKMASGWTHPAWRKQGVFLELRRRLLEHLSGPQNLYISTTIGPKAPFLLARLGWQVLGWGEIAYVSSLIGWFEPGRLYQVGGGWRPLAAPGMKPYEAEPISPDRNPAHNWEGFYHFWVSNIPLGLAKNRQLSILLNGDLRRWREAIMAVFS